MENKITCFSRKYRIQTSKGLVFEVESEKPLSIQLNAKLLEEDKDIDDFFKNHTINNMRQMVMSPEIKQKIKEESKSDNYLSRQQRLNRLLEMEGSFTRQDYIDYIMKNFKYKLNKWTSHNDIKEALKLKRIEIVEKRKGPVGVKYKVIDTKIIDDSLYKKLLEERKLQISTIQD
jgi:hypothetical protein